MRRGPLQSCMASSGRLVAKPSVTFWLTVAVDRCREPGPQWTSMGVSSSAPLPQNQPKLSPAGRIGNSKR